MGQVVTNLLNNAAKYTEKGGHIWISLSRDGEEGVLSVRDDGIGISAEMLPRVFDLFAQASRSLARSQGGLGIGLTLARRLVALHGGSLSARSGGLGKGSEFVVQLPIVLQPRTAAPLPSTVPSAAQSKGLRVLVVDDNSDAADSLAMLLKASGHEGVVVYDGQAALDCASQRELDVIFLDIGLPGMDGYEVARRLRQQHGARSRLVALTGYGQPDDREMARRAGFDYHLVKPVTFARVQQALSELCSGH
jgi:CheY-like chemotaxis protein